MFLKVIIVSPLHVDSLISNFMVCSYLFCRNQRMASFRAFLNSPVGPKTTHFWGPIANWGFVAAVCLTSV